jgi:hypothetical protein
VVAPWTRAAIQALVLKAARAPEHAMSAGIRRSRRALSACTDVTRCSVLMVSVVCRMGGRHLAAEVEIALHPRFEHMALGIEGIVLS